MFKNWIPNDEENVWDCDINSKNVNEIVGDDNKELFNRWDENFSEWLFVIEKVWFDKEWSSINPFQIYSLNK